MKNCRPFGFYGNKLSNCSLSLVAKSHKLQIHVSVCLLTIKMNARMFSLNFPVLGNGFKFFRVWYWVHDFLCLSHTGQNY